jgi:hypothetical protein
VAAGFRARIPRVIRVTSSKSSVFQGKLHRGDIAAQQLRTQLLGLLRSLLRERHEGRHHRFSFRLVDRQRLQCVDPLGQGGRCAATQVETARVVPQKLFFEKPLPRSFIDAKNWVSWKRRLSAWEVQREPALRVAKLRDKKIAVTMIKTIEAESSTQIRR